MSKVWSGGERGIRAPLSGPAAGVSILSGPDRPSKVRRRPTISFARLRGAIDWGFVGFSLAVVATGLVLLHVALGRLAAL